MKPLRFYSKAIKKTIVVTLIAVIMLILLSLICKFAFIKTMQRTMVPVIEKSE